MFAPYFPADEPQKFANVHKVFGASNVNKMLQVIPTTNHTLSSFYSLLSQRHGKGRFRKLLNLLCEYQAYHAVEL